MAKEAAEQVSQPEQTAIYPGRIWRDTNGRRIQAHGGALFYEDGIYYWYGENKDRTDGVCNIWTWGIRAYASKDMYNWEDLGLLQLIQGGISLSVPLQGHKAGTW